MLAAIKANDIQDKFILRQKYSLFLPKHPGLRDTSLPRHLFLYDTSPSTTFLSSQRHLSLSPHPTPFLTPLSCERNSYNELWHCEPSEEGSGTKQGNYPPPKKKKELCELQILKSLWQCWQAWLPRSVLRKRGADKDNGVKVH